MSNEFPKSSTNRVEREREPRIMARVTFSRHEETQYTGIGRDISPAGIERAQEKGARVTEEKGVPTLIGYSPMPRAVGTAESIEEGVMRQIAEGVEIKKKTIAGLSMSTVHDPEAFKSMTSHLGSAQENWAHAHHKEPWYYDNPDVIETNEEKRARMYEEFERLVSVLERTTKEGVEPPHLVFVSHFELITLLLDDVFGIDTFGTTNVPTFGEHIDLEVYAPATKGDAARVSVHYKGHQKDVLFDRGLRRPVALPKNVS